jgi:hypothetical protein
LCPVLLASAGCYDPKKSPIGADTDATVGGTDESSAGSATSSTSDASLDDDAGSTTQTDDDGESTSLDPTGAPMTTTMTTSASDATGDDASTGDDTSTGEPAVCGDGVAAPGELCFDELVLFDGGDVTYASRITDVDGDGDGDLVWMIGDQIAIRLGVGDGTFGAGINGPTLFPSNGEIGDVDGDGIADFAIVNEWENTLVIARGDGRGNFTDPVGSLATGMTPRVVRVFDLDGEAGAEVLVGSGDGVSVFKSDGDVSPQPGWGFSAGGTVHAIGFGDFDGDGDRDLVYVRETGGQRDVVARLGDGDASFSSQSLIDFAGTMPMAVEGGDFDGDGDGDIAYVDGSEGMLYVQLGNGAFGFGEPVGVATDADPRRMLVVDATGDGHDDVVVGHGSSNALWILPGDGAAGFGAPLAIPLAGAVDSLGVGEVNGDGVPDFVTTDTNNEHITVIVSTP